MRKWPAAELDSLIAAGGEVRCGSPAGAVGLRRALYRRAAFTGTQVRVRLEGLRVIVAVVPRELMEEEDPGTRRAAE
jgi:hypothetical protein